MLKIDSQHRRLSILVSRYGAFYTPTTPEGYCEAQAMADLTAGRKRYSFQPLRIRRGSWFRRSRWIAGAEVLDINHFPKGWKILEGRKWKTPKLLTPEQARKKAREAMYA